MNVLVAGAQGQVGREVPAFLAGHEVVGFGRTDLDVADRDRVLEVVADVRPHAIVNCAAYNAVDRAETDVDAARAVNVDGPRHLAEAALEVDAHLVHISTDYVFDGEKRSPYVESDEPNPLSAYGRSKLEGEQAVAAVGGAWTVVRTALVFGAIGRSLVETILRRGRAGEPLRMVDDQHGSPTSARDLAAALAAVVDQGVTGHLHLASDGGCTPYELAREIFELAGLDASAIERITADQLERPARRPMYSVLGSERAVETGIRLRSRHDALRELVPTLLADQPSGVG